MNAPQITFLVIFLTALLISANKHGQPKEQNYNFFYTLISVIIWIVLLYWGNFFN